MNLYNTRFLSFYLGFGPPHFNLMKFWIVAGTGWKEKVSSIDILLCPAIGSPVFPLIFTRTHSVAISRQDRSLPATETSRASLKLSSFLDASQKKKEQSRKGYKARAA
jgi:hypothetical protein